MRPVGQSTEEIIITTTINNNTYEKSAQRYGIVEFNVPLDTV